MANKEAIRGGMMLVIGVMITLLLAAELLPSALDTFFNVSTSEWSGATAAIWAIIPLVGLIGILGYYLGQAFDFF